MYVREVIKKVSVCGMAGSVVFVFGCLVESYDLISKK